MDHLSSSQINLYLQCALKYKFQYIDQFPKPFRPSALAFGSAVHSALAWFHEEKMKGNQVTLESLYRIFDADWFSMKIGGALRYKEGEQEMALVNLGKEFLTMYAKEEHPEIKGSEVHFSIPLVDTTTGEDFKIDMEGFFDLVEGEGTIVEFKTSAQTLSASDIDNRLQLTAYCYAYEILNHKPPAGLKVVNFVKARKPKMVVTETKRGKGDYQGFFYIVREVLNGIRREFFPPRMGFWCRDCEYAAICPLWKHTVGTHKEIPSSVKSN